MNRPSGEQQQVCPGCQTDNPAGAKFCNECGTRLPEQAPGACPACGTQNAPTAKFCNECGTSLAPAPAKAPPPPRPSPPPASPAGAPAGERKNVAVLFADLSGFTAMSETLDPEEVTRIMNTCFQAFADPIQKYEGTIDKYIGDCVMALFGAPVAHEDDPERALFTALEMMSALDNLNRTLSVQLGLSIGINYGQVVAGEVGAQERRDYTVMGDAVNTAQRLEGAAERGQILVSAGIRDRTEWQFRFTALEPIEVKGKREPLPVYQLLGVREQVGEARGLAWGRVPLVGRGAELELLEEAGQELVTGRGNMVCLSGQAGIGKTRMRSELESQLRERDVTCVAGSCVAYGDKAVGYQPIREIVRQLCQLEEETSPDQVRARLDTLAATAAGNGGLNRQDIQFLGLLLGTPFPDSPVARLDAQARKAGIFLATKKLFLARTNRQPLMLAIDDLHWGDALSLDILDHLVEFLPTHRLLLLCAFRPDFTHEWPGGVPLRHIRLKELSGPESLELMRRMLNRIDLPKRLQELVLRVGGIPFYLEELVKHLLTRGVIQRENGHFRIATAIEEEAVPERVHDLIAARIDQLPSDTKTCIHVAAVIGRAFPLALLAAVWRRLMGEAAVVEDHLPALLQTDLVVPGGGSGGAAAYQFKNPFIREVAYHSLLKRRRRELHAEVAGALETLHADRQEEHCEALAHHYLLAEEPAKSVQFLLMAGRKAEVTGLYDEAVKHYSDVLKALEVEEGETDASPPGLLQALLHRGELYEKTAEFPEATTDLERVLHLAGPESEQRCTACILLASVASRQGRFEEALEQVDQTEGLARRIGFVQGEADAANVRGIVYFRQERWTDALRALEPLLELRRKIADPQGEARALNNIGLVHFQRAEFPEALECHLLALDIREEIGDLLGLSASYNNLGIVYCERGEFGLAHEYHEKSLEMKRDLGNRQGVALSYSNLGDTHLRQGDEVQALTYLESAVEIAGQIGDRYLTADCWHLMARAHHRLGDAGTARSYLDRALDLARELDYGEVLAGLRLLRAHLAETPAVRRQEAEAGLALAEEVQLPALQLEAAHLLALAARAEGDEATARRWFARVRREISDTADQMGEARESYLAQPDIAAAWTAATAEEP